MQAVTSQGAFCSSKPFDSPPAESKEFDKLTEGDQGNSPSDRSEIDSIDGSLRRCADDLRYIFPETSVLLPVKVKSGNKKSFVWNYFRHPEGEAGIVDRTRTQCLICKSQLAFNASGTTTTMLNHLKSRHGDIAQREEQQRASGAGRMPVRRKDSQRGSANSSFGALRGNHVATKGKQNGYPDFHQPPDFSKEDLQKFPQLGGEEMQANKGAFFPPFLSLGGLDPDKKRLSPLAVSEGGHLIPPPGLLNSLAFQERHMPIPVTSTTGLLPPPFPIPPTLDSTGPFMPHLPGFMPPNFALTPPFPCCPNPEGAIDRSQPPSTNGDPNGLALAKAWLSSFSNLTPDFIAFGAKSSNNPKTKFPPASPTLNNKHLPQNLADMGQLLKGLPALPQRTPSKLLAPPPHPPPPPPPELLATLFQNNPLVMNLLSKSQSLLGVQVPPPTNSAPPEQWMPPPTTITKSASLDLTGTAKRKRGRPVYITPDHNGTKRQATDNHGKTFDSQNEVPEDLTVSRQGNEAPQSLASSSSPSSPSSDVLEERLAHFLVRDMHPPEFLDGEGFKAFIHEVAGAKVASLGVPEAGISSQRMRREVLPRIAARLRPQPHQRRGPFALAPSLAVEFWQNSTAQKFVNLFTEHGRLLQTSSNISCLILQIDSQLDAQQVVEECLAACQGSRENKDSVKKDGQKAEEDDATTETNHPTCFSCPLVTNQPQELSELLQHSSSSFTVLPCLITALSTAISSGFRVTPVASLLKECRQILGSSSPSDTDLSWRDASELLHAIDAEKARLSDEQRDNICRLKSLVVNLNQTLEFIREKDVVLTASMIWPILTNLRETHLACTDDDHGHSDVVKAFKEEVAGGLDNFFPKQSSPVSDLLQIASLIDPRFKERIQEAEPNTVKLLKAKVEELSCRVKQLEGASTSDGYHENHNSVNDGSGLEKVFGRNFFVRTSLSEVDRYLREESVGLQADPLKWWSGKLFSYPILGSLARHYLAVPLACFNLRQRLKTFVSTTAPDKLELPGFEDIFPGPKSRLTADDGSM
uniref:BED-type domain-containing protein n=1 Tax=Mesocestoides corti TaxID=53468 RepID=A0A5K3F7K6_MESCO